MDIKTVYRIIRFTLILFVSHIAVHAKPVPATNKSLVRTSVSINSSNSIKINPNTFNVVEIKDVPLEATHYMAFVNYSKGSNLRLYKNQKRKKINKINDSIFLKIKSGERYSSHTLNYIFYKQTSSGLKMIEAGTRNIVVNGNVTCPEVKEPVCGIKYVEGSCNPLDGREICFFGFDSTNRTYDNGLCGLEADGAEFLHAGKCQ